MIDKDILINDLEMEFAKANSKYLENDEDPFYGGICSADNFSIPAIGRYEEDEDGSSNYYIGDDDETCLQQELFVNAWMELPQPYRTETEPKISMNDIKLQCKIGDMIRVEQNEYKVSRIVIEEYATTFFTTDKNGNIGYVFCDDDIGKTVFVESGK